MDFIFQKSVNETSYHKPPESNSFSLGFDEAMQKFDSQVLPSGVQPFPTAVPQSVSHHDPLLPNKQLGDSLLPQALSSATFPLNAPQSQIAAPQSMQPLSQVTSQPHSPLLSQPQSPQPQSPLLSQSPPPLLSSPYSTPTMQQSPFQSPPLASFADSAKDANPFKPEGFNLNLLSQQQPQPIPIQQLPLTQQPLPLPQPQPALPAQIPSSVDISNFAFEKEKKIDSAPFQNAGSVSPRAHPMFAQIHEQISKDTHTVMLEMTKAMREMVLRIGSLESDVKYLKEKNEELTKLVKAQGVPKPQDIAFEKRVEQEPQKTASVNTLYDLRSQPPKSLQNTLQPSHSSLNPAMSPNMSGASSMNPNANKNLIMNPNMTMNPNINPNLNPNANPNSMNPHLNPNMNASRPMLLNTGYSPYPQNAQSQSILHSTQPALVHPNQMMPNPMAHSNSGYLQPTSTPPSYGYHMKANK